MVDAVDVAREEGSERSLFLSVYAMAFIFFTRYSAEVWRLGTEPCLLYGLFLYRTLITLCLPVGGVLGRLGVNPPSHHGGCARSRLARSSFLPVDALSPETDISWSPPSLLAPLV